MRVDACPTQLLWFLCVCREKRQEAKRLGKKLVDSDEDDSEDDYGGASASEDDVPVGGWPSLTSWAAVALPCWVLSLPRSGLTSRLLRCSP